MEEKFQRSEIPKRKLEIVEEIVDLISQTTSIDKKEVEG